MNAKQTTRNGQDNLAHNHPAFQRHAKFLHDQVEKCRPSAIKVATARVISQGFGLNMPHVTTRIAEEVDRMEMAMFKRLMRKAGMTGKYLAH